MITTFILSYHFSAMKSILLAYDCVYKYTRNEKLFYKMIAICCKHVKMKMSFPSFAGRKTMWDHASQ